MLTIAMSQERLSDLERKKVERIQGRHFNFFLGSQKFFEFINATGLLKNWKKQHIICSNLTLFMVPFFPFFSLFFTFFFSFFFLGGTAPQPPSNDASERVKHY